MNSNTFKKRSGTTDKGKDYENYVLAYLLFKLTSNDTVKNFHVSSNDVDFGDFDDIVLDIELSHQREVFALQLKHSNKNKTLPPKSLEAESGDFSLRKYFNSFQDCKEKLSKSKIILWTNKKLENGAKIEVNGCTIEVEKCDPVSVLNICEEGQCYRFRIEEGEEQSRDFVLFVENFLLYTNQENFDAIKERIFTEFQNYFQCEETYVKSYLEFVEQWSIIEGVKEKIDKTTIQQVITLHLLSPVIHPLKSSEEVDHKMKLLREAIDYFQVTVFDEGSEDATKIWGDVVSKFEIDEEKRLIRNYQLRSVSQKLDDIAISKLLWLTNKCPLVISANKSVYKAIELCPDKKFVVVATDFSMDVLLFRKLSDLRNHCDVFNSIKTDFTFLIQGKEANLNQITSYDDTIEDVVTTDVLLLLVKDNGFKVGGDKECLSQPYIDRSLTRNLIAFRYLHNIAQDTLVVITKETDILESENLEETRKLEIIKIPKSPIPYYRKTNIIYCKNENEFQRICERNPGMKNFHHFRRKNDLLEWVQSKGDISDLQPYRLENSLIEESYFYTEKPTTKINLIRGDPGVGKSELMKSLSNCVKYKPWTVVILPRDMDEFCEGDINIVAFKDLIIQRKYKAANNFEKEIFETLLRRGYVVVIWDALDEINEQNRNKIKEFVVYLSEHNVVQWITFRSQLKQELEIYFSTLSRQLVEFNLDQQMNYLKKKLENFSQREVEEIFRKTNWNNIISNPLHISMLTELISNNSVDLLTNAFSLATLYTHFIDKKFEAYWVEKMKLDMSKHAKMLKASKQKMMEDYSNLAMLIVFEEEILKILNIDKNSVEESDECGFVVNIGKNRTPEFIHRSYADYFAALYIQRSKSKSEFRDILFDESYVNVRFFFDLLMTENSCHISVINRNPAGLSCDEEMLSCKDDGGRTVLHLLSSWGQRCSLLEVEEQDGAFTIDDQTAYLFDYDSEEYKRFLYEMLEHADINERDTIFEMDSLSYAEKCRCLHVLEAIGRKHSSRIQTKDDNLHCSILYYATKLGLSNSLNLFLPDLKFIKTKRGDSLLHLAVRSNNVECLEKVLSTDSYKTKLNEGNIANFTPLHLACAQGFAKIAETLVKAEADVNCVDVEGKTPLFGAISNGHLEVVELLLDSGAAVNAADTQGRSLLHFSSQDKFAQISELLIAYGADVNRRDNKRYAPLHYAAFNGQEETVKLLTSKGAAIDIEGMDGRTPLHCACWNGNSAIVDFLIQKEADLNSEDKDRLTPLHLACYRKYRKTAELLIRSGANSNAVDSRGRTPLFIVAANGNSVIAQLLIDFGAKVDLPDNYRTTPLIEACCWGHEEVAQVLIAQDADVNARNMNHLTPLSCAYHNKHGKIEELLEDHGASTASVDNVVTTPLHVFCTNGFVKGVKILLGFGVDVETSTEDGWRAIHAACCAGNEEIVRLLLNYGADINTFTDDGKTLLALAREKRRRSVVMLLNEYQLFVHE